MTIPEYMAVILGVICIVLRILRLCMGWRGIFCRRHGFDSGASRTIGTREIQEDEYAIAESQDGVMAVLADGKGKHAGGKIASHVAVEEKGGQIAGKHGKPKKRLDQHGLFLFETGCNLQESLESSKADGVTHEEQMLQLMYMYQTYHNIVQKSQYASRGSRLVCQYGAKPALLDTLVDHGVYAGTRPVMTCADCERLNLHDFGSCMCPESFYENRLPMTAAVHRNGIPAKQAPYNKYPHICVPLVNTQKGWYQAETGVFVEESNGTAYQALLDRAFLVCQYGGMITIPEVPDTQVNETEPEEVLIASWLKGYKGTPDAMEEGIKVEYSFEDRAELKSINPSIDWYSYESQTKKNKYCENYLVGQEFIDAGNGVLVDQEGRYWITLGPKVIIPDYSDEGTCAADEFKEYIGCRVDVVLQLMKEIEEKGELEEYVYIECVWSGNIKAHTFNNGIYQTGHPYPNSPNAKKEPYQESYVNGSIVEFTGMNPQDSGVMSKYIVAYLIVYPK